MSFWAIVAVAAVAGWIVAAMWAMRKPQIQTGRATRWSSNSLASLWQSLKKPQNESQFWRVVTWLAALAFAGITWLSDPASELGEFRTEATSIAIAVVFIEEIARRRQYLEFKQSIIRQLGSRSNDFALDAARIAVDNKWHTDGSLKGAVLVGARLEGAFLMEAHLEGASLIGAHLEGADLKYAILEGTRLIFATYDSRTRWPDDFDPVAAGAILVDDEKKPQVLRPGP